MIDDQQVLLVTLSSLEGPVEGAGKEELTVDNHELVVHVELLSIISTYWDATVSQVLAIVTLVLHTFVIGDDADIDSSIPSILDSIGKIVIGQVKDTDKESLLGHLDVFNQFGHVSKAWEEESIHVFWLWSIQVFLKLGDMLSEIGEYLLALFIRHLRVSDFEESIHSLLDSDSLSSTWHLAHSAG